MRVSHIAGINYACPPEGYGGTQRCMAQMIAFQAALCAHDVTLYGSADSAIVDFSADISRRLGLASSSSDDVLTIVNADGRTGSVRLRTTGHPSDNTRSLPETIERIDELIALLLRDERTQPYDIIHSHTPKFTRDRFIPAGLMHKTLTHNHKASAKVGSGRHKYPLICISRSQARNLRAKSGADVFAVVHHGLDPFTLKATTASAGYLAWIGHFAPKKGADTAIAIAKRAGMPIVLAGVLRDAKTDREYFEDVVKPQFDVTEPAFLDRVADLSPEEIAREIASLGRTSAGSPPVVFAGSANEAQKQTLLGNAAATLFPIRWAEPFGLVMIESMACGTPVIGTVRVGSEHRGSVEEVIEDGVTGFHVSASDEEEVVERAARAADRLGELDRTKVRATFERDWSSARMARALDETYRRFLKERTSRGAWRRMFQRLAGASR